MYVTDRHDMTLAVKLALNLNTTNKPTVIENVSCGPTSKSKSEVEPIAYDACRYFLLIRFSL